jgi:hypothetical protein
MKDDFLSFFLKYLVKIGLAQIPLEARNLFRVAVGKNSLRNPYK